MINQEKQLSQDPLSYKLGSKNSFLGIGAALLALCIGIIIGIQLNGNQKKDNPQPTSLNKEQKIQNKIYNYENQLATIFAIGGVRYDPVRKLDTATNSAEFYTFSTDTWSYMPQMNEDHAGAAVAVYANKIYVFGGQQANIYGGTTVVEEFDPEKNTWTIKKQMPRKRMSAQAVNVGGKIYVFGDLLNQGVNNQPVDIYNPSSDTWGVAADIPLLASTLPISCAPLNNKIYCPGIGEYAYTLVYDPTVNKWTSLPTDNRTNSSYLTWAANSYDLYAPYFSEKNFLLTYDAGTDTLTKKEIGDYIHRSYQGYGMVAFDNFLLLIGGRFSAHPVRDVYLYGFNGYSSWVKTTPLNLARSSAAVTILPTMYTGDKQLQTELGSISGVITTNSIPVPGKKVMLSTGENFLNHTTTFTDLIGKYSFPSLSPGTYQIGVEQDTPGSYSVPIYNDRQQVELKEGEKITDYNYDTTKPW